MAAFHRLRTISSQPSPAQPRCSTHHEADAVSQADEEAQDTARGGSNDGRQVARGEVVKDVGIGGGAEEAVAAASHEREDKGAYNKLQGAGRDMG